MQARSSFETWSGVGPAGPTGDIDVGLWPNDSACTLSQAPGSYPRETAGAAIGFAAETSTLLVTGGDGAEGTAALTVNLGTGKAALVDAADGPRTARSNPTVTPFGGKLLVAGGVDPDSGDGLDSADTFDPALGRFDPERIELSRRRAHHGAVVLGSGDTLLVGGQDSDGTALRTLEVVSPDTREYRISGLARLDGGRLDPTVLRLSDDTVLVAGGTGVDGAPVSLLEWLDVEATDVVRTSDSLPGLRGRAYAAMPGGGALAVGGCENRPPVAGEDAACASSCGAVGCPSRDVYWISPDGTAVLLPDALDVTATNPVLVSGSEGRPWLAAGLADARVFRVFDPLHGVFVARASAPQPPSDAKARFLAVDPGLLVWLATGAEAATIGGFRHGTRGPFTAIITPVLLQNDDDVTPDRPLPASFADDGGITLDDAATTLFVADTTYADLTLTIAIGAGDAPVVRLGDHRYGGDDCPWPLSDGDVPAVLVRHGDVVTVKRGDDSSDCDGPRGRVSIALATPNTTSLKSVSISREAK
jgi:hypothetical protein